MSYTRIATLTVLALTGAANASEMWFTMPQAFAYPVVRIAGAPGTAGTISSPAGFDQSFVIGANHSATVSIPSSYKLASVPEQYNVHTAPRPFESKYSGVITNNGFVIRTDNPAAQISAIFDDGGESTSLLDKSALSTSYLAVSSPFNGHGSYIAYLFWSAFSVVGTTAGTQVTITPRNYIHGGHPAGTPFTLTLNAGQAVLFAGSDVNGTSISSTAPVAVLGSHGHAIDFFSGAPFLEQLPGTDAYRTAFVVATTQFDRRHDGTVNDIAKVTAAKDNTIVMYNGVVVATLNAGEHAEFKTGAGGLITASEPVLLTKTIPNDVTYGSRVPARPSLEWVPGIDQWRNDYTFDMPSVSDPNNNYVDVAIATADLGSLMYNGALVPGSACTPLAGTIYSTCEWTVSAGAGEIWDDNPFLLSLIPYGTDMTFATPATGRIDEAPEPASLALALGGLVLLRRRARTMLGKRATR